MLLVSEIPKQKSLTRMLEEHLINDMLDEKNDNLTIKELISHVISGAF